VSGSYLSVDDVLGIHEDSIDAFGGASWNRDPGALEAAVMRPQSGYYPDVIAEAAALWESLSQNHPFVDGNKRTAIAATAAHLAVNGYCRGLSLPSMIPSMMLRPVPPMMWLTTVSSLSEASSNTL
jgi:prophage maintenance system killer protein